MMMTISRDRETERQTDIIVEGDHVHEQRHRDLERSRMTMMVMITMLLMMIVMS